MEKLLSFVIKASISLAVFLIPLLWSPWTFESFEFPKQYMLIFLVLLGIFAWVARMVLVEREVHFKRTSLNLPILLFALVAILSSIFSTDIWSSLFGYYGRFSDGLFSVLAPIGLYFLIINTVEKPSFLVRPFLLSGAITIGIGFFSLFGVVKLLPWLSSFSLQMGMSPIASSSEVFLIFLAFLVSFFVFLSARPEIKQLPWVGNLLLLFSAFALLLIGDLSEAWIVLLAGLLLVILSSLFQQTFARGVIRLRRLWLPITLLFFTVIFLFSTVFIATPLEQFQKETKLSHDISWNIALQTISESGKNLMLGSGPGTFALNFSLHKTSDFNQTSYWQTRFDRAGNYLSELLGTMGILGFLLYLGVVFWFLFVSLFFVKDKKSLPFALGVIVLFIAQFLYYQTTALQITFWLFLSLAVISWDIPKREFHFSLRKFLEVNIVARVMLLVVLLGMGSIFFFGARFFVADMNYFSSQNTLNSKESIQKALVAVRFNPWQAEYKILLSKLYLKRALGELRKPESVQNQEEISNDIKKSIAYMKGNDSGIIGAIELSPNKVYSWEALGAMYRDIHFIEGSADQGIDSFTNAVALEPTNPVLYTELGKLYIVKKELKKGREYFEQALELKSDYAEAQLQIALLKEREGDITDALIMMAKISLRYPLDVDAGFQYGRLLYNTGKVKEAILQFERIVKIAPNHSNVLFSLGTALESQGRIEEAKIQFEKVRQLNPENTFLQELKE